MGKKNFFLITQNYCVVRESVNFLSDFKSFLSQAMAEIKKI